jgi:hypothetical protein
MLDAVAQALGWAITGAEQVLHMCLERWCPRVPATPVPPAAWLRVSVLA